VIPLFLGETIIFFSITAILFLICGGGGEYSFSDSSLRSSFLMYSSGDFDKILQLIE